MTKFNNKSDLIEFNKNLCEFTKSALLFKCKSIYFNDASKYNEIGTVFVDDKAGWIWCHGLALLNRIHGTVPTDMYEKILDDYSEFFGNFGGKDAAILKEKVYKSAMVYHNSTKQERIKNKIKFRKRLKIQKIINPRMDHKHVQMKNLHYLKEKTRIYDENT